MKRIVVLIGIICLSLLIIKLNIYDANVIINESLIVDNQGTLSLMIENKAGSGEYVSSADAFPTENYVFNSNLSKCENGGSLSYDASSKKVIMESNSSDKCYIYFDKEPNIPDLCENKNASSCIMNNYIYDNGIKLHNANLENGAGDNSYRYTGKNPNNYVCFGTNELPCPTNNTYRIIGIFDNKIKLIKESSIGSYYWGGSNTNNSNDWNNSTLNTTYLNKNFLETIPLEYQNKILVYPWYIGGITNGHRNSVAKVLFDTEAGTKKSGQKVDAKIGLMYVSDYAFAVNPIYWTITVNTYNQEHVTSENWLFSRSLEWTISKQSDSVNHAYFIDGSGLTFGDAITIYNIPVRPTFYLDESVLLLSGLGTKDSPYYIK